MRWLLFLLINVITLLFQLVKRDGVMTVISENLLLKQQLIIVGRPQHRTPALMPVDWRLQLTTLN